MSPARKWSGQTWADSVFCSRLSRLLVCTKTIFMTLQGRYCLFEPLCFLQCHHHFLICQLVLSLQALQCFFFTDTRSLDYFVQLYQALLLYLGFFLTFLIPVFFFIVISKPLIRLSHLSIIPILLFYSRINSNSC